jgi:small subunit ribosomal protein S2e
VLAGFGSGFGGRRGDRGRGDRGRGDRGGRGRGRDAGEKEWVPVTKLGRLVYDRKITSLEQIYLFALPIKEYQIIDFFLPAPKLKDEVMKISPVQKQTRAGQRTRMKAYIVVGDSEGHVGVGVKCAKEVATAIRGAIILAKLNLVPVRLGYWGNKIGQPHTVPCKVTGKCGSVSVRLVPAPRGTGIVAAPVPKKLLHMAGVLDVFTCSRGKSRTLGNFVKATFGAVKNTYGYLTPDLWDEVDLGKLKVPYQEHTDFLAKGKKTSALSRADYARQ